jgi:undecaprenyl diphosphate synthase
MYSLYLLLNSCPLYLKLSLAASFSTVIDVSFTMLDATNMTLPRHLAIIMDGNGRWAKSRGLPRVAGHKKGADSVRTVVTSCRNRGIKVLTLFAFSLQNWSRPAPEVKALMKLLSNRLVSERPTIMENNIRLTAIGELDFLPSEPRDTLFNLIDDSAANDGMDLCLALSYGGREEICNVTKKIADLVSKGEVFPEGIDDHLIDKLIWSSDLGPVDFLIRTSGEQRISNFLLWQLAYSELYFTDRFWPDFDESALDEALNVFSQRQRRFGQVK